jgi:hypothetical protein
MEKVLINGKAYAHAQIVATIAGVPVASISEVEYKETQDKSNNYGIGSRPISRGYGTTAATASVTLAMAEVEQIRDAAPDGSLLKIPPFDLVVTFLNDQRIVTHIVKNCEFLNDGVESKTGEMDVKMKFDLLPSHVLFRQ